MNEEELAVLNAQLKQLLDLQSDAAEIMKAKFASLNEPLCYTQKQTRTRTADSHFTTVSYGRAAADPDKHNHELQLSTGSKRRPRQAQQPKPSLLQCLANYLFPPKRSGRTTVNIRRLRIED